MTHPDLAAIKARSDYADLLDKLAQRALSWKADAASVPILDEDVYAILAMKRADCLDCFDYSKLFDHSVWAQGNYQHAYTSRVCSIGGKFEDLLKAAARAAIRDDLDAAIDSLKPEGDPQRAMAADACLPMQGAV